jgi:hypothetical protein
LLIDRNTDLSFAIIDDQNFLKYLHEKGSQNVPVEIRNKQELEESLLKLDLLEDRIDFILSLTVLR